MAIFDVNDRLRHANERFLKVFDCQQTVPAGQVFTGILAAGEASGWFVACEPRPSKRDVTRPHSDPIDLFTANQRWSRVLTTRLPCGHILREVTDVTAERRAKNAVIEERNRSKLFFEVGACVVLKLDATGRIEDTNEWAAILFEASVSSLKGMSFVGDLVLGDHREVADRLIMTVSECDGVSLDPVEFDVIAPGGRRLILRWRAAAIRDDQGAVRGWVISGVDITEHRVIEEQITFLASHDEVTGLPNRSLFLDRLNVALAQARREDLWVAVLFIDLDGFKSVNDNLGHEAGDMLLRQVADRLMRRVRASDTAARFGGDEFAIVLAGLKHRGDGQNVAEDILDELARPFVVKQASVTISASVGLSYFPDDSDQPEDLIRLADGAMYAVKHAGKNGIKSAREAVALK